MSDEDLDRFRKQEKRAISHDEPDGLQHIVHHSAFPHTAFSLAVNGAIRRIGKMASWCWPLLVAVICVNVIMRYAFGEGRIEFEELQWHIYALGFMLGLSYTFEADDHVRVDIVHEHLGLKVQGWIELMGICVFLLPFTALVVYFGLPFVQASFAINEISDSPGGLPFRWLVKGILPVAFILLAVAAVARISRVTSLLFGFPASRVIETRDGPVSLPRTGGKPKD